jgi:hypothetical protein
MGRTIAALVASAAARMRSEAGTVLLLAKRRPATPPWRCRITDLLLAVQPRGVTSV